MFIVHFKGYYHVTIVHHLYKQQVTVNNSTQYSEYF